MKQILDFSDVVEGSRNENYEGKIIVISLNFFKPEYQNAKFQLFKAEGGFGCDPNKLGSKIFGYFTDEDAFVSRCDVLGIAKPETIAEWEEIYGKFGKENRRRAIE